MGRSRVLIQVDGTPCTQNIVSLTHYDHPYNSRLVWCLPCYNMIKPPSSAAAHCPTAKFLGIDSLICLAADPGSSCCVAWNLQASFGPHSLNRLLLAGQPCQAQLMLCRVRSARASTRMCCGPTAAPKWACGAGQASKRKISQDGQPQHLGHAHLQLWPVACLTTPLLPLIAQAGISWCTKQC